jgi:hypothetical protein
MMEAASTSETSVNFYQTIRLNNPEDSHLHCDGEFTENQQLLNKQVLVYYKQVLVYYKPQSYWINNENSE